jgi:hypothetical protein
MNTGIIVLIVLLVPVLFQVVMHEIKAKKRNTEVMDRLKKIEDKLNGAGENR